MKWAVGLACAAAISSQGLAARAEDRPQGDTDWALPGFSRVSLVAPSDTVPRLSFAATAAYGRTEALSGEVGPHHRARSAVAASVLPVSWLAFALRLDGRVDIHPRDDMGSDKTFVGDPRLSMRVGGELDALPEIGRHLAGLGLGAEVILYAPGADAPSLVPRALSLDVTGLASYRFDEIGVTVATEIGYRRDRSANVVDRPEAIRQGDRVGLGLSEFDALLLGVGGAFRTGPFEAFGELTWDVLLGELSPSATTSPMRLSAGARLEVTPGIDVELLGEWVPSSRPELGIYRPLVPIEPRLSAAVGLRARIPLAERPPEPQTERGVEDREVTPVAPVRRIFRGRIIDADGTPLTGAEVRVEREGLTVGRATTGADGRYVIEDVPEPPVRVVVAAEGFEARVMDLRTDQGPPAAIPLTPAAPVGWLRGIVRSYDDEPVQATILIEPAGEAFETGEDGTFELELGVGTYEISIEAEGYYSQRRRVDVEDNGVTVVNADLRRRRRRQR